MNPQPSTPPQPQPATLKAQPSALNPPGALLQAADREGDSVLGWEQVRCRGKAISSTNEMLRQKTWVSRRHRRHMVRQRREGASSPKTQLARGGQQPRPLQGGAGAGGGGQCAASSAGSAVSTGLRCDIKSPQLTLRGWSHRALGGVLQERSDRRVGHKMRAPGGRGVDDDRYLPVFHLRHRVDLALAACLRHGRELPDVRWPEKISVSTLVQKSTRARQLSKVAKTGKFRGWWRGRRPSRLPPPRQTKHPQTRMPA